MFSQASKSLSLVIVVAFLIAGCASATQAPPTAVAPTTGATAESAATQDAPPTDAPPPASEPAALGFTIASRSLHPGVGYFWIGDYTGYFAEEGIDPTFTSSGGGAEAIQALVSGEVQVASAIQDTVLKSYLEGNTLPITCFMNTVHTIIYQFAVTPDSPLQSVADLKGKRIGVNAFGAASQIYAEGVLSNQGLDPETDVTFLAVEQGAVAAEALQKGEVDALALWDFTYANMQQLGYELRFLDQPAFISDVKMGPMLCASNDFLRDHRDLAVSWGRAVAKSMVFFTENQEAVMRIHWDMFPESRPTGVSEADALLEWVPQLAIRAPKLDKSGFAEPWWGYFNEEMLRTYFSYAGFPADRHDELLQFFDNSLIADINAFDEAAVREQAQTIQVGQ